MFCDLCESLLVIDTQNTKELVEKCTMCGNVQKVDNNLIFSENFVKNRNKDNLIKYACDLITVPRQEEYCPSCKKKEIVAVLRKDKTLEHMYICCKCRNNW